jgi:hypothetical protein
MKLGLFNKFKINIVHIVLAILVLAIGTGVYLSYFSKYKLNDQDAMLKAAESIEPIGELKSKNDFNVVLDTINSTSLSDQSGNDEYFFDSEISKFN